MASKKAKQKKVLDKAKQLVLKNKKGKAKAKPKQRYPEGQNAPQSKAYQIDNDKTQVAKATGYRFTTEGAKRLGKTESDRPTQAEIEKYRNQTFKVKGKVNKSGPKGTGDGSFRYIYIERRADKADLKRNQKLAHGGSIDDKRERVIDYYLQMDVFDDFHTYGLTEEDLMDAKKSKSYKKIEDAIVKYHGLDDDENVKERFETLGLEDDEYAHGGETKNAWGVYYNGKLMFKESSEQDAHKSAKMLKSEVDMPFAVSVEKIDEEYAKGGKVKEFEIDDDETGKTLIFKARSYEEALEIADKTDFNDFEDGVVVDVLIYNDDEYAKGGKTKNLPTKQEFREFQEYVFSFYGKDGIYGQTDYFEGGATTEEILLATNQYVTFCAKNPDLWGGGDSTDREIVRDIMQYHRGENIDGLEHGDYIKRMKKTTILEYGGILQTMIGGVNADPRFDIYNTTMFAEDGAMLELGGENPDEKLKVTIHVDVYEDDYEEGEGKNVNSYTVDWLKNPIVKADDLLEYLYDNVYLSRYATDYTIDDDGFIHTSRLEDADGREASESEIEKWKKGEMKLYSAHYLIIVEAVGQTRKPSQSELHDVTDIPMYEDGGEMAKGGKIKDQYKQFPKGSFKREKGVWNAWTPAQRLHFLNDHADELTFGVWGISKSDFLKISEVDYDGLSDLDDEGDMIGNEIFVSVNDALNKHIQEGQYADGGKIVKRRYLQGRGKNVFTFGYGMPKDSYDMFGTKGGTEYFIMPNGKVYKKTKENMNLFEFIGTQDEYAKGGKTHEQGYDDREDESLAMRHGKIATKDFVGSHKRREHSRRDDAQFETRNKK